MSDELIVFYAFNQNKIIVLNQEDKTPDLQELISVISNYKISYNKLSKHAHIVKLLAKKIYDNNSYYGEIEKKILDKVFFGGKITTLVEIFNNLPEDSTLKKRLNVVLKESSECFICMERESDTVFSCAHQMCNICCTSLDKQECPFCREMITTKMNKVEFQKYKEEVDKKKKEDRDKIEKEIEEKLKDGTYDYYDYADFYNSRHEFRPRLQTLHFVDDYKNFIENRLKYLLLSNSSLSSKEREEIVVLTNYDHEFVWNIFTSTKISSEEVIVQIVTSIFKKVINIDKNGQITEEEIIWLNKLEDYLCSPNRILRFLAVFNGKEPKPDQKIMIKFPNRIKKFIMYLLDKSGETDRTYSEILLHRPIWKLIGKSFHASDHNKYGKYKTAQKIIQWARTNDPAPIRSKYSIMEKYLKQRNKKIFEFFLNNPGLFYRNAKRTTILMADSIEWKEFIPQIVKKLKTDQLIQLSYVLETPDEYDTCKESFVNKAGIMHWHKYRQSKSSKIQVQEQDKKTENVSYLSALVGHVIKNTKSDFKKKNEKDEKLEKQKEEIQLKKYNNKNKKGQNERISLIKCIDKVLLNSTFIDCCIIDNTNNQLAKTYLRRGKIPSPVEWTSKIPASRGDAVSLNQLDEKDELVIGIYWKNGESSVDLDLSTCGLDENFNTNSQWKCDYTQLTGFNGTVRHSGDITNAPTGASEYIRFSLKVLKEENPNMRYLLLSCLSFNSIAFEKMGEALVWIGKKNPDIKGDGPYECQVIDACKLEGNAQVNMGAYIDLEQNELVFTNLNLSVGRKKGMYNSIASREYLLRSTIENFIIWKSTKSCPPTWQFVAEKIASCSQTVIIKFNDNNYYIFNKKEHEEISDYYDRIKQYMYDEYLDNVKIKSIREENKDLTWVYLGNGCNIQMPSNSYIVSTQIPDTEDETITHLSDPLKMFDIINKNNS